MKQHRKTGLVFGLLGVITLSVIGLIGCRLEDRHSSLSGPALSVDESVAKRTEFNKRNPAQYTPGTVPGIAVTMDFTEYHIDGWPYGDWTLHASWRACRKGCPELVTADVPVAIDASGQGTAHIPPGFLNEVFQFAQQKFEEGKDELGVWWNAQALVLDLYGAAAEGETLYDYYNVDLGREGWTYKLSAGAVAGGMQQALAALSIGWYPGKPGGVPQDLALALYIGRCIGVTEIPPTSVSAPSCPSVPQECVVQNTNDNGAGSLRQALADLDSGAIACPTLTFADAIVGQRITLTSGQLDVNSDAIVDGCSGMTIDGNAADRVMEVASGVTATLDALTITNGDAGSNSGGGIYNQGSLTISSATTISDNGADLGGGIYNQGSLTIGSAATVSSNGAYDGGGIYNQGTITIDSAATVSGNGADIGGGIYNDSGGTLTIHGTVRDNGAFYDGGGIFNDGTLTVHGTVRGNEAYDFGGGIFNGGTLTVHGMVSSNWADLGGGGIFNGGTLTVSGTVSGNEAYDGGGGIFNGGTLTVSGTVSGNGAPGGGGILNDGDSTLTANSTVSGNEAIDGGGIYHLGGTLNLSGTISNNTAWDSGGGIYNDPGTWGTLNVEIFGNHCDSDDSGGETGGGIYDASNSGSPAGVSYPSNNYRGSGTGTADDYNGIDIL